MLQLKIVYELLLMNTSHTSAHICKGHRQRVIVAFELTRTPFRPWACKVIGQPITGVKTLYQYIIR
jgi:hypothetical protein